MIKIIKAKLKNSNFFLSLRNDKKARSNSKNKEIIKVSDHKNWFKKALKSKNYKFFVIKYYKAKCGYLRLEKINRNYFVSIFVLSKFRKKKLLPEHYLVQKSIYIMKKTYLPLLKTTTCIQRNYLLN